MSFLPVQAYWESDVDNTYSYLRQSTTDTEKALYNELKVRPKNYFFDPRFRAGRYDGFERFFDLVQKRLLTGMIPFARQIGFDFEEIITAKNPLAQFNVPKLWHPEYKEELLTLNEYQEDSLCKIVEGARRGIFDHITASGKTAEVAAIASMLSPLNVLVIVPSIELLIQTTEELEAMLKEPIGVLGSGKKDFDKRVVVCYGGFIKQFSRSGLVKQLAQRTHVLICDELQTVTKRLFSFFRKCTNAYYRYGFSGSFFDVDPARIFSVAGYFGGVITTVTDEDTKQEQRTVPPHFTFFEYPVRDVLKDTAVDYGEMYYDRIVDNNNFNKYFATLLKAPYEEGKTILVLVKRVEHCKRFQEALAELQIESNSYNGQVNTEERRKLRSSFKNGLLPILVATEQTMGVGVNIPRIELLLNLGLGLSDSATRQKYGRSLRSFEDKTHVDIYEPYITSNRILLRHSKARLAMAKRYSTGQIRLVFLNGVEQKM